MIVYLDGVIGLNFLVDWMLLLGVNRLAGYPPGVGRTAAAAAVGGGYAGMCMVPSFGFLASGLWRVVSLAMMSVTAFGMNRSAWSRGVLFVVLSMAMGGLALCFQTGSFPGLVATGAGLAVLCRMGLRGKLGQKLQCVELCRNGKTLRLLALVDTGNTLRDPLTGEPVLVVSPEVAPELVGIPPELLKDPASLLQPGMRLIPCSTIGNQGQLLLAVRCDRVCIGGKPAGRLIAFGTEPFGGEYQALTGGQYG